MGQSWINGSWYCLCRTSFHGTPDLVGTRNTALFCWNWPGVRPDFGGRGLEWWLSLWVLSLGCCGLLGLLGGTVCHPVSPFGYCRLLPEYYLSVTWVSTCKIRHWECIQAHPSSSRWQTIFGNDVERQTLCWHRTAIRPEVSPQDIQRSGRHLTSSSSRPHLFTVIIWL